MLRMICPKCHHHFPIVGCCLKWSDETNEKKMKEKEEEEGDKESKKKKEKDEEKKEKMEEKEKEEEKEDDIEEQEKEEEEEEEDDDEDEDEEEEEEEEEKKEEEKMSANTICSTYYVSSLPISRGYTSGSSCFLNPSTKIHEPTVFQSHAVNYGSNIEITGSDTLELFYDIQTSSMKPSQQPLLRSPIYQTNNQDPLVAVTENLNYEMAPSEQYVTTTCELTGGSVTIATPDIQSGDCLIQNTEPEILVQASEIKIQPKHTGGGCLVQKKLSTEDGLSTSKHTKNFALVNNNVRRTFVTPPNGCLELPGNIRVLTSGTIRNDENNEITNTGSRQRRIPSVKTSDCCDCKSTFQQNHCQCHGRLFDASLVDNRDSLLLEPIGNSVQFRVNATVQLPANLGQCTVNITATTTTPPNQVVAMKLPGHGRNNFHGGGLVQPNDCSMVNQIVPIGNNKTYNNSERNETSTSPFSWLPSSLSLDADVNRLREVKRLLQICGWYHEGISWQQSENLLKDAPIGRWLMRDSSDSRYTFAISVKTARGPASIRVHYFLEQFRLDAEPKLALAMPFFDCPIKMLEHYVEYSKRMDERREVWVDYSGQLYSQIYLTNPLVKEVRSLSHLARLTVNRSKLPIDCLPLLIKNYIEEYPYTL